MRMRWEDLLFAHWPIEPDALRPFLPAALELDTFDGAAYLGIVPFRMADVAPRGLPAIPRFSSFPELNVRTYVTSQGRPGVWFLSLDAASRPTVIGARRFFQLPYVHARMSCRHDGPDIVYRSDRRDHAAEPATFAARYRPSGPVEYAAAGSLDDWLTARWRLFAQAPGDASAPVQRSEIRHAPWPLQPATAEIDADDLAAAHGLTLPGGPPQLRFARRVDVRAWWPRPAEPWSP